MELTTKELMLIEMVFKRIDGYGGFASDGKELLRKVTEEINIRKES